ncbi:MAG: acyl-CoA dehydrogenase family protein [Acidimicrobiales bacterium]
MGCILAGAGERIGATVLSDLFPRGDHEPAAVDSPAVEFELSSEQAALSEAADGVLGRHASRDRVRELVGTGDGRHDPSNPGLDGEPSVTAEGDFDRRLWSVMAAQGWLGIERSEEDGGLGLGMVEVCLLCEQLGRHLTPAPFIGSMLALGAFEEAARDADVSAAARESAREWADRLSTGKAVGCVAWAASAGIETNSTDDDRRLLSARPEPTVYASAADVAIVVAGHAVYEVPLSGHNRPAPEPAMDRTRSVAWLRLVDTPARRIGGTEAGRRILDRAATAYSAELLGAAARVLEMSVEYAKDRVQFGKPIGGFQAVKHRLADALVDVEGMRSSVYYAAWCIASGDEDASLAASAAKVWCSDASRRVMASGLQVHGGVGFTWEHDLHLYLKRAQLDETSFGDAAYHRERIATLLSNRQAGDSTLF